MTNNNTPEDTMNDTRTTAEIIRDAKIRAASDPVLARAAARELARRQATRMRNGR